MKARGSSKSVDAMLLLSVQEEAMKRARAIALVGIGALITLGVPRGGISDLSALGKSGGGPGPEGSLRLEREAGLAEPLRRPAEDARGTEVRRLELERKTREAQRDTRREREEQRIRSSGTRDDLERYQRTERSKETISDLGYDLDRRMIAGRLPADPSAQEQVRALDFQRDIERSLDKVEFERRQRRPERELWIGGEPRSRQTVLPAR
jgi:hypothetical protein